jgi:transcriptional regulator with XRE-family HTH domain
MLAEVVRRLREDRGWSLADLAERAEVSEPAVAGIESGREVPEQATIDALARALRVDVSTLLVRWGDFRQSGPFAAPVRALMHHVPSPIGTDAFRLDRILDNLVVELLEVLQQGEPSERADLEVLAYELRAVRYPSPLAEARGHAFSECTLGMLDAYRGNLPNRSSQSAAEQARTLVSAAFDDHNYSAEEFQSLFSSVARIFASWYIAAQSNYLDCVQAYLLERTELDFVVLAKPEVRKLYSDRYDLVSGLGSVLGSMLVGVASSSMRPPTPRVALGV